VKKTRLPAGAIRKISVAVLVDQTLSWEKDKGGFRRVLAAPSADKLKVVHDQVAGVTGFNADRGDQLVVETQPFETTLTIEPPQPPAAPVSAPGQLQLDRKLLFTGGGSVAAVLVIGAVFFLRRKKKAHAELTGPGEVAAGGDPTAIEQQIESRMAQHEAQQQQAEAKALNSLKLAPVITKTAEVMAKHLREKIKQEPEISAQVLRSWVREEDS
jgi:flagellar biosynthesis/type III secretory pathway M-ring protein FliF/YscJ